MFRSFLIKPITVIKKMYVYESDKLHKGGVLLGFDGKKELKYI